MNRYPQHVKFSHNFSAVPLLFILISWRFHTGWHTLSIDGANFEDRAIVMTISSSSFQILFEKSVEGMYFQHEVSLPYLLVLFFRVCYNVRVYPKVMRTYFMDEGILGLRVLLYTP